MRVLLTGATGQLGDALQRFIPDGVELLPLNRSACDLADFTSLRTAVRNNLPDIVINAAAYTQVDKAETERDLAFAINAEAPRVLAETLAGTARLIHVSTDFVFDGSRGSPYPPDSPTRPLNVYGASKLAGEQAVLEVLGNRVTVIRTAWVYSSHGSNFVKTMLRLMSTRDIVRVVSDQVGSPTAAISLAQAIWAAVKRPAVNGILHWTDAGVASWYDFAVAIEEEARSRGLIPKPVSVVPIAAADYAAQFPGTVRRPAFSVLDTRSAQDAIAMQPLHWRTRLREVLDEFA